jgi:hypothetical protein
LGQTRCTRRADKLRFADRRRTLVDPKARLGRGISPHPPLAASGHRLLADSLQAIGIKRESGMCSSSHSQRTSCDTPRASPPESAAWSRLRQHGPSNRLQVPRLVANMTFARIRPAGKRLSSDCRSRPRSPHRLSLRTRCESPAYSIGRCCNERMEESRAAASERFRQSAGRGCPASAGLLLPFQTGSPAHRSQAR